MKRERIVSIIKICLIIFVLVVFATGKIPFIPFGYILFPVNSEIFGNESRISSAKLYSMKSIILGENKYVLWMPNKNSTYLRDIYIVDLEHRKVGVPNSSPEYYKEIFNIFLFQRINADWFVSFDDGVKGWDFNPNFNIDNKGISFETPDEKVFYYKRIRIEF